MKKSVLSTEFDQSSNSPAKILRSVLDACSDCDTCRFMDGNCLFLSELYRLYDKENKTGSKVTDEELIYMASLCTLCGLCPCPNIPADIIRGKTEYVRRNGLPFTKRMLSDVQRFGKVCGYFNGLVNLSLDIAPFNRILKKIAGIHPHRQLPQIPKENFFSWAKKKGLCKKPNKVSGVVYYAGCTAGYFFPEVAKAVVTTLQANNVSVYVPPQQCCGMPALIEGDKQSTLRHLRSNMEILLELAESGFDLVFSCPTCSYLMKVFVKEGAYYSEAYQRIAGSGADEIRIPENKAGGIGYISLQKSIYKIILKDDGYFSGLDPLKRISLSDSIFIIGDYLMHMLNTGKLNRSFGPVPGRFVNFVSCHQREQQAEVNTYKTILALIPGLSIKDVGGSLDCCGMGGSLGFKKDFHEASIKLGGPLFDKIKAAEPEAIVTDCLSCRLQFMQLLPYPVYHPLEVIARSYTGEKVETGIHQVK